MEIQLGLRYPHHVPRDARLWRARLGAGMCPIEQWSRVVAPTSSRGAVMARGLVRLGLGTLRSNTRQVSARGEILYEKRIISKRFWQ